MDYWNNEGFNEYVDDLTKPEISGLGEVKFTPAYAYQTGVERYFVYLNGLLLDGDEVDSFTQQYLEKEVKERLGRDYELVVHDDLYYVYAELLPGRDELEETEEDIIDEWVYGMTTGLLSKKDNTVDNDQKVISFHPSFFNDLELERYYVHYDGCLLVGQTLSDELKQLLEKVVKERLGEGYELVTDDFFYVYVQPSGNDEEENALKEDNDRFNDHVSLKPNDDLLIEYEAPGVSPCDIELKVMNYKVRNYSQDCAEIHIIVNGKTVWREPIMTDDYDINYTKATYYQGLLQVGVPRREKLIDTIYIHS